MSISIGETVQFGVNTGISITGAVEDHSIISSANAALQISASVYSTTAVGALAAARAAEAAGGIAAVAAAEKLGKLLYKSYSLNGLAFSSSVGLAISAIGNMRSAQNDQEYQKYLLEAVGAGLGAMGNAADLVAVTAALIGNTKYATAAKFAGTGATVGSLGVFTAQHIDSAEALIAYAKNQWDALATDFNLGSSDTVTNARTAAMVSDFKDILGLLNNAANAPLSAADYGTISTKFFAIQNASNIQLGNFTPSTGDVIVTTDGASLRLQDADSGIDLRQGYYYNQNNDFTSEFDASNLGFTWSNKREVYSTNDAFSLKQVNTTNVSGERNVWTNNLAGGPLKSTSSSYDADGNLVRGVVVYQDNKVVVTSRMLSGGATRQDIYDEASHHTGSVVTRTDGSKIITQYDMSGGSATASQTFLSSNNSVQKVRTIYDDGSYIEEYANGSVVSKNSQGELQMLKAEANEDSNALISGQYAEYVQAVALSLATQFTKLLFAGNLPAALSVGAFTGALINTAFGITYQTGGVLKTTNNATYNVGGHNLSEAQAFLVNFGTMLAGSFGGVVGSEIGGEIFKAVGLPENIGSLAGSVVGSVGAQYLAREAAEEFFNVVQVVDGKVVPNSFVGSLELNGVGAIGSFLGSELSTLIVGNGGIESQIGGAVGSVIGSLVLGGATLGIGTFLGPFVGSFLGSIFGGLFGDGYRGEPSAVAQIGYYTNGVNNKYALMKATEDNNGNTQLAVSIASTAVEKINILLGLIGGTVNINSMVASTGFVGVNASQAYAAPAVYAVAGYNGTYNVDFTNVHSAGYFDNNFFYTSGDMPPGVYPGTYSSAEADVGNLIIHTLRTTPIIGGNEYMKLAVQRSAATNFNDFISDLNAANDYSIYIKNPLAFDVALASANDAAAWNNWNAELVRIQAMGLDTYSHGTLVVAAPVLQLTSAMRSVVVNGNVAGNDVVIPVAGSTFGLILASGLTTNSYWFSRTGNDLVMNFFGSGHTTTIQNWYAGNSGLLQSIALADGTAIGADMIDAAIAQDATIVTIVQAALMPQIATLTDIGIDAFGTGLTSRSIRTADGHVGIIQLDSSNAVVARQWLTDIGSALTLDANTYIVGSGQASAGHGNYIIIQNASGSYQRWDISASGDVNKGALTSTYNATNATLYAVDSGTSSAKLSVSGNSNTVFVVGAAGLIVSGDTKIFGDAQQNVIVGGSGNDWLYASGGGDQRYGGGGGDIVIYTGSDSITDGGTGIDWLAVQSGVATINLGNAADQSTGDTVVVTGFENVDGLGNSSVLNLTGDSGANFVRGGIAADTLAGGGGDDAMCYDASDISTDGGAGNDTLYVNDASSRNYKPDVLVTANLANAADQVTGGGITTGFENVDGSASTVALNLTGDAGSNILKGGNANDVLDGGAGADTLVGGAGTDYIYYDAADISADAGAGVDILMLKATTPSLTINLANTGNQILGGNIVTGFEYVHAVDMTAGVIVSGDANNNTFNMGSGNDTIDGAGGIDALYGNGGDDRITYDAADSVADGGSGVDTLVVNRAAALTIDLRNADQVAGDSGTTTGFENVDGSGSTAALTLFGDVGANILKGGSGNDLLGANIGNDIIYAGAGNDNIYANVGDDIIYGGAGNDIYNFIRGDGADTIFENDATVGNIDYLKFASGVNYDQLWFKQIGSSLEVDVIGTSDKVTIDNWFLSADRQVESIQAGGKEIYNSSVINLVNAMAGMTAPAAGQTTLTAAQHAALDPVIAANWHAA